MKIYLGTDHAGFSLKEKVKIFLKGKDFEIEDCGAFELDKSDDYPDFISKAAQAVSNDPDNSKGLIFGGSGQGEMMLANKFKNIRCALFYGIVMPKKPVDVMDKNSTDPYEIIHLTREHNNANILSIGTRFTGDEEALSAIKKWLTTPFSEDERHIRRINKIKEFDNRCH